LGRIPVNCDRSLAARRDLRRKSGSHPRSRKLQPLDRKRRLAPVSEQESMRDLGALPDNPKIVPRFREEGRPSLPPIDRLNSREENDGEEKACSAGGREQSRPPVAGGQSDEPPTQAGKSVVGPAVVRDCRTAKRSPRGRPRRGQLARTCHCRRCPPRATSVDS